jgi:hypothetical protein
MAHIRDKADEQCLLMTDEAMPLPGLGLPTTTQSTKPAPIPTSSQFTDFALPGLTANAPPARMPPSMPPLPGTLNQYSNPPYSVPPPKNPGYGAGPIGRPNGGQGFTPPPSDAMGPRRGGPLPSQEQMLQSIGYEPPQRGGGGGRGRRRG